MRTIVKRARAGGVGAGIHSWLGAEREIVWARDGLNFLIHSGGILAMKETLTREVGELRAALGDAPADGRAKSHSI